MYGAPSQIAYHLKERVINSMSTVKLFGSFTSPFVRHCCYVFKQLELPFEFVEADYDQSAADSPMKKVPYMSVGDLQLTDSSSIVKYAREKAGQAFLPDVVDFDRYTMINTIMDAAINLFLFDRCGITPEQAPYMVRQQARIDAGLAALEANINPEQPLEKDCHIRIACFVDWAVYRGRMTFTDYPKITALAKKANDDALFAETAPPPA